MAIKMILGDSQEMSGSYDMIFTDPPFEMHGAKFQQIIANYEAKHLVFLTTMRQLLEFNAVQTAWQFRFDFVFDVAVTSLSRSFSMPNYTHRTGVYFTKNGEKTAFSRRGRMRSDSPEANHFWPTIFRAPRLAAGGASFAKNDVAVTDLMGSFVGIKSIIDPFAGGGSTGIAAHELGINAVLVEKDDQQFAAMRKRLRFIGAVL